MAAFAPVRVKLERDLYSPDPTRELHFVDHIVDAVRAAGWMADLLGPPVARNGAPREEPEAGGTPC